MTVQKTIRHPSSGFHKSGNSLRICRHDSWRCWWLRIVRIYVVHVHLYWVVPNRQLERVDGVGTKDVQLVVTVNCRIWELTSTSSVATVTSRSTEPEIGMTSFDADISGRVSSFWSVGVPIFFQVELDSRLHDAPVSTKKGNLRLLMETATDGVGSLTSSVKELMVDVVMRLTLDDLCLVIQAASLCPFLPKKLQTALDRRQSSIAWPFFPQRYHRQWCNVIVW